MSDSVCKTDSLPHFLPLFLSLSHSVCVCACACVGVCDAFRGVCLCLCHPSRASHAAATSTAAAVMRIRMRKQGTRARVRARLARLLNPFTLSSLLSLSPVACPSLILALFACMCRSAAAVTVSPPFLSPDPLVPCSSLSLLAALSSLRRQNVLEARSRLPRHTHTHSQPSCATCAHQMQSANRFA